MIETFPLLSSDAQSDGPKELSLLSIIAQAFFQPFSVEENLLVVLTGLTAGSGVGFNRAMLFRTSGETLKGEVWLGPRSAEDARTIWNILSTPGIGYAEMIEHNRWLLSRESDSLTPRIKSLAYPLTLPGLTLPALCAAKKEVFLVRDARRETLVDSEFLEIIDVDEFLCVPLYSQEDILGAIILDNAYSRQAIDAKDIKLAGLCGLIAGNYISATTLHKRMIELEKLAALGELSMFITHQIRNPLTAIGGFLGQLANAPDNANLRNRNLGIIRQEMDRLEDVLAKLARFLKVDVKTTIPFDLRTELETLVQREEFQRPSEGRALTLEIEGNLPRIQGDPTYIDEALRNLLDNAFEATPGGGTIAIRGRYGDPWVIVEIQDSGAGMSPAVKEKLFSPFFSTKNQGFGLGLLFVKRVMESLGGKIEIDSAPGRGTRFRLFFKSAEERRQGG
jgi:signal transduction histidine kinase